VRGAQATAPQMGMIARSVSEKEIIAVAFIARAVSITDPHRVEHRKQGFYAKKGQKPQKPIGFRRFP
jgi:hypothetical protein